jgi:tetratricopeptide (TPR) repeat protein
MPSKAKDQGDYERAIADFSKAIELDPGSADAYNRRGAAYDDLHEYEQAIADYSKSIEFNYDPLSWPYYNRGRAYYEIGDHDRAIVDFEKALELGLDPNAKQAVEVMLEGLGR